MTDSLIMNFTYYKLIPIVTIVLSNLVYYSIYQARRTSRLYYFGFPDKLWFPGLDNQLSEKTESKSELR